MIFGLYRPLVDEFSFKLKSNPVLMVNRGAGVSVGEDKRDWERTFAESTSITAEGV